MQTEKKLLIGGVVALVIIIAIVTTVVIRSKHKAELNNQPVPVGQVTEVPSSGEPASSTPSAASSTPQAQKQPAQARPAPALTYTQAVKAYQDRRIQFDNACTATPNYLVYKNPVNIMLDNRSNSTKKITVNGQTYQLAAYDFTTIIVNVKNLPQQVKVGCGQLSNAASILMEK